MMVKPLSSSHGGKDLAQCPQDFSRVMGLKLPAKIYTLVCTGMLSPCLPAVLATGDWSDRQAPLVDSFEYRQLLDDLKEYRQKALGLLATHLAPQFHKRVTQKVF